MHYTTDDLRIEKLKPLIPPAILMEELPLSDLASENIANARREVVSCVHGTDKRPLCLVGPCSIHDTTAALEYAQRLYKLAQELKDNLCIIMRVYFEKPRTTVGWKGLINDPNLDNSFNINKGLRIARRLLLQLAEMGLPAGCEYLDTIMPQFLADLVSWGAIGARTTESQVHRELASGLSTPIGFKNGTDGNIQIALDAISAASHPHHFLSVTKQSVAAIVATKGNHDCHVILRGSNKGTNYHADFIEKTANELKKAGLNHRIMVDCSHGNSKKIAEQQKVVIEDIGKQYQAGTENILGIMVESHLNGGNQKVVSGKELVYGQSITDAGLGWQDTEELLRKFAKVVRQRC